MKFPKIRFGIITTLLTLFIVIALILFTPIASLFVRLLPQTLFNDIFQEITLAENPGILNKPLTFNKSLPILGSQSGICFSVKSGNMTNAQRDQAKTGKPIANITAISPLGERYALRTTSLEHRKKEKRSIICQKLGRSSYSTTADKIVKIIITPNKNPFTPTRIFWVTAIDAFNDRVDYVP